MDKVTLSPSQAICTIFAQPFSAYSDQTPYRSHNIVEKLLSKSLGDMIERTVWLGHTSKNHFLPFQHQYREQAARYPGSDSQR